MDLESYVQRLNTRAVQHARRTSNPDRFLREFTHSLSALQHGADLEGRRWGSYSAIRLAADIEALSAMRALESFEHPKKCKCVPCCIRTRSSVV